MQRSKQQAVFFILGAVLVGGALGFSADRLMADKHRGPSAQRQRFYDRLELTEAQRSRGDSMLDEQNCQINLVMKPVKPVLDSIRASSRQQWSSILTAPQLARLDSMRAEMSRRDSVDKARRDSVAATRKTTVTCRN
jgi:hypothetical protein